MTTISRRAVEEAIQEAKRRARTQLLAESRKASGEQPPMRPPAPDSAVRRVGPPRSWSRLVRGIAGLIRAALQRTRGT